MRKRAFVLAGAVIVAAAGAAIGVQLYRNDDPELLTQAPAIATATAPAPAGTSPAAAGATGAPLPGGTIRYVVGAGSSAKYVVREKLANLPASTNAVGQTTSVSGELLMTGNGLAPSPRSTFRVDLRTLQSDESRRDNTLRMSVLRTSQYPNAEFALTSVSGGFPAGYREGDEVSFTISGNLTLRGQAREVTWQVKARRSGDTISAVADTSFTMTDFGITPPDIRGIAKAEDGVQLQVVLVAKRAG